MQFNNTNIGSKDLSLQIHTDGFFICSYESQEYFPYSDLTKLKNIPENYPKTKYTNIRHIFFNNSTHFVPKELVNKQQLNLYVTPSNLKIDKEVEEVRCEEIQNTPICNVYSINKKADKILQLFFGNTTGTHFASFLYKSIHNLEMEESKKYFFIHLRKSYFDIFCIKEKKLHFFNTFSHTNEEGLLYFIFSIIKAEKLDIKEIEFLFLGDFPIFKNYYELIANYSKKINFIPSPNIPFSTKNPPIVPFFNHILV